MDSPLQINPVFHFPGDVFFKADNALVIDPESLLQTPRETYEELAISTSSLILRSVPAAHIEWIIPLFGGIRHLKLDNVDILNRNLNGMPLKLQTLIILDSRIAKEVAKKLFEAPLVSVQIFRSYYSVPFHGWKDSGSFRRLLQFLPRTVQNLSTDSALGLDLTKFPLLQYLHVVDLDMGQCCDQMGGYKQPANTTVKTLICRPLRNWFSNHAKAKFFENLLHLRITPSISAKEEYTMTDMLTQLQTLDVHCFWPPHEVNQILTLNDDCLLHILSFLFEGPWSIISKVHPRFRRLIRDHILPYRYINIDRYVDVPPWLLDSYFEDDNREYYFLAKHVKHAIVEGSLCGAWTDLESLYVKCHYRIYPKGLKRLTVKFVDDCYHETDYYDQELHLANLNDTLNYLTVQGSFDQSKLVELHNIKEFEARNLYDYNLIDFLTINMDHLESLKIHFESDGYSFDPEDVELPISRRFVLCPLKSLEVLHLTEMEDYPTLALNYEDFPVLRELNVSFTDEYNPIYQALLHSISKFIQLEYLSVWFKSKDMPVDWLGPLKNLDTLGVNVETSALIEVLGILPKVSYLDWYRDSNDLSSPSEMAFESGELLKKHLRSMNRTLSIYFKYDKCLLLP